MSILDSLTRRQVVEILEKGVLDGRIRDNLLFKFEGSRSLDAFTDDEKEILEIEANRRTNPAIVQADNVRRDFQHQINLLNEKMDMIIYQITCIMSNPSKAHTSEEFRVIIDRINGLREQRLLSGPERIMRFD